MSGNANWKEVKPSEPCQVCGSMKWCRVSGDGLTVICMKQGTHPTRGTGKEKTDKDGNTYWVFFLGERTNEAKPTRSHTEGRTNPANAGECDRVYRALLKALPPSTIVDEFLDRRGVPDTSPLRKQYRFHALQGRFKTVQKLLGEGLEPLIARTPGFFVQEKAKASWWTLSGAIGIAIPIRDHAGRIIGILLRPEHSKGAKYLWLSSTKKGGAKARRALHVPAFDGDRSTVRLTEGAVKADIATELGGMLTIGLPGLYAKGVAATLKRLKVKTVRLAFDADCATNTNVAQAVVAHWKKLTRAGYTVELERWDEADGKGIDDLLAAGKSPELVTGEAVAEAINALVRTETIAGERVAVRVTENEGEVVRQVVEALAAKDDRLYQKHGELVEVVWPSAIDAALSGPKIVTLTVANIRTRITDVVSLFKIEGAGTDNERLTPINPPSWLAGGVKDRNCWPGVRPLVAVTGSPVLRADGTVHQTPGYDPATGLLYAADGDYAPIPENPTRADARQAVEVLRAGVRQFPWKDETDFAAWLAEVVTITVRHAIPGPCPLFFHTANSAGSGKGALAGAAAFIGTGREIPLSGYPITGRKRDRCEDAEELRKLATAAAIEGHIVHLLDNVPSGWAFGSSALDAIATSTANSGRELKTSNAPSRPALTVWILTGNNIHPTSDTVRRCIPVRLYSSEEKPDEREYDGPEVTAWARAERGKLFTAALTIAAAYIRAGRPSVSAKPFGSYEAWSGLVRAALIWCGLPDPCANRAELAAEDGDLEIVRDLIKLLELASPSGAPIKAADITKQIGVMLKPDTKGFSMTPPDGPLVECYRRLCPNSETPDARRLGKLFSTHRGRVLHGKRVERNMDDAENVALWSVTVLPGTESKPGTNRECDKSTPGSATQDADSTCHESPGVPGTKDAIPRTFTTNITPQCTPVHCASVKPDEPARTGKHSRHSRTPGEPETQEQAERAAIDELGGG